MAVAERAEVEPYGIVFTKGALWYNESSPSRTPSCASIQDREVPDLDIPGGGDIVRNMDVTRDGNPVLANSLVNQVGLGNRVTASEAAFQDNRVAVSYIRRPPEALPVQ